MAGYATIMAGFYEQTFVVQPRPTVNNALSTLLIVSSDSTLDGDRYRTYTSLADVQTDATAGDVSATGLALATVAFAQSPRPTSIAIGRRDGGGSETFATALAAISNAGLEYGLVGGDSTTGAHATSIASVTDANPMIALVSSADSGWLTGTIPSGYPTTSSSLGVAVHPTSTEYPHIALLAAAAATPADQSRADFTRPLVSVATYNLMTTQYNYARTTNKANPFAPLSSGGTSLYPPRGGAVALSGEYLYTRYTVMFLTYRWRSAIETQYAVYAAKNKVWPYNQDGETALFSCLVPTIQRALQVGYLSPSEELPSGYAIEMSRSGGEITATVRVGLLDGTTKIITVGYLERAA